MKDGVEMYGGFAGTETALSLRNIAANNTVLSGDIGIAGDRTDNCYQVINNPSSVGITAAALLDGFTVSGGNGAANGFSGGGMYNDAANPVVRNCIFEDNYASNGGAMYNTGGALVVMENVVFRRDSSSNNGGAVYCIASNTSFTGCTFDACYSSYGGAVYADNATITIDLCSFTNNNSSSSSSGAAVNISNSAASAIKASMFSNNRSYSGGAIYLSSFSGTISNCTFSTNHASPYGGAIYMESSSPLVSGCTFYNNNSASMGGAVYASYGVPNIVNCTIYNNQATSSGAAFYLQTTSPRIVNCLFWDNLKGGIYNDINQFSTPDSVYCLNNILRQGCPVDTMVFCTNTTTTDPVLAVLSDNGGDVSTCALNTGSPALNAGVYVYQDAADGTICYNTNGGSSYLKIEDATAYTPKGTITRVNGSDARGVASPQGAGIDLGAYEME
jgi:hypothetical protein